MMDAHDCAVCVQQEGRQALQACCRCFGGRVCWSVPGTAGPVRVVTSTRHMCDDTDIRIAQSVCAATMHTATKQTSPTTTVDEPATIGALRTEFLACTLSLSTKRLASTATRGMCKNVGHVSALQSRC